MPAQLAVVAVVVAVGLAVTCWWLVRGSAHDAPALAAAPAPGLVSASPTVESVADAPGAGASGGPSTGAAPGTVTVDVAGKVRRPGIAVLDAGSRVVDALEAAGGARPGVDLTGLNLARVLVDGEQIVVGGPAPAACGRGRIAPGRRPARSGRPGQPQHRRPRASSTRCPRSAGDRASRSWRGATEHGGFTSVDELLEVDGIGEVTLGKLAPYVTV